MSRELEVVGSTDVLVPVRLGSQVPPWVLLAERLEACFGSRTGERGPRVCS